MAVKSFLVCSIERFNKDNFLVPIQNELLDNEGVSEISVKIQHTNFHDSFDQYQCRHDFKHNKSGRVFGRSFNYYFEQLKFYTYYSEELNLSLIQTKTDAAIDFSQKLNETEHYIFRPIELDFSKVIPHITEVAGAWIADLKKTNLKTVGFFGPNVNRSEEYKEAAAEGNISSLQIRYISSFDQREHYVGLSKKGSIILYTVLPTIEDELNLVLDIYNKLIKPHL